MNPQQTKQEVTIRRLPGDFSDSEDVELHQVGCCCCCCIQVPVSAACGLMASASLLSVGYLPVHLRRRWPMILRLVGAGTLLGAIAGSAAVPLWTGWDSRPGLYVAGCATPAALAGVLAIWAVSLDRSSRDAPDLRTKWFRSFVCAAALGASLGSSLLSAISYSGPTPPFNIILAMSILLTPFLGMILGYQFTRLDTQQNPGYPEPRLARLAGALIGANLLMAVPIGILAVHREFNAVQLVTCLAVLVIVGAWSAFISRRKILTAHLASWRSLLALWTAADALVGGTIATLLIGFGKGQPNPHVVVSVIVGISLVFGFWIVIARRCNKLPWKEAQRPDWAASPLCPKCGYNLTGLSRPRCPECGQVFDWTEVRRQYLFSPFPITFWHPLTTSPAGLALFGIILAAAFARL